MSNGKKVTIEQFGTGFAIEVVVPPIREGEPPFVTRGVHADLLGALHGFIYHFGQFDYEIVPRWQMQKLRAAVTQEAGQK